MTERIKLNLGCGHHKLIGFDNLDKRNGWLFQNGLSRYVDNSIDAITISHALMYMNILEIEQFLKETFRVLTMDGVIRITEDDTENPLSDTYQTGWKNRLSKYEAVCLTGPIMMRKILENSGFKVYDADEKTTHFIDASLMQNLHRGRPRCFFIEGIKN